MKQHIEDAIELIKGMPVKGCITGSCLLGYFPEEKQDIDVFIYDEKSFNKILFAMLYNDMFQLLDKLEKWKFEQYINSNKNTFNNYPLVTIKFVYNTCIDVNIILKKNCNNIFAVLSSFDMSIICKGYDIETKQYLDLTNGTTNTKISDWNRWNTKYYDPELWETSRILRQLGRVFKYHKRGYNTDLIVKKYISLIEDVQKYQDIFHSESYSEKLAIRKNNTKIVKKICEVWLETHKISDEQIELLNEKLREI